MQDGADRPSGDGLPQCIELCYAVLFRSSAATGGEYRPIVPYSKQELAEGSLPHLLDKEVAACLPVLWYCLHLPRDVFDVCDVPLSVLLPRQSIERRHRILLLPVDIKHSLAHRAKQRPWTRYVLFYPNELSGAAGWLARELGPSVIDLREWNGLSQDALRAQWEKIAEEAKHDLPPLVCAPNLADSGSCPGLVLPHWFIRRQSGPLLDYAALQSREEAWSDHLWRDLMHCHCVVASLERLESEGCSETEAREQLPDTYAETLQRMRRPLSLGLLGVPPRHSSELRRLASFPRSPDSAGGTPADWRTIDATSADCGIELSALQFMVTHRALANNGVGHVGSEVPNEAFVALAELERHCRATTPKPRTVRRLLEKLQHAARGLFTEQLCGMVRRASALTVFSNFPVGLLTLPGDSAPLTCRLPIAYRPLVPMTRAVQAELRDTPVLYMGAGFRLLLAQCIPLDDRVGQVSVAAFQHIASTLSGLDGLECDIVQCGGVDELRAAIADSQPLCMVLSAHGVMDETRNFAGLQIGRDLVLGPELDHVPPLVILSSCHTSPRGTGTVNAADILVRAGAVAVLGTLVPVDVYRNAVLIGRLFTYVHEVLRRRAPFKSFGDLASFVLTSNAVHDILSSSKRLQEWMTHPFGDGTVLEEFANARSVGKLHGANIYRETEALLREMAAETGHLELLNSSLASTGYFPESIFYTMVGWPERFIIRDDFVEEHGSPGVWAGVG